MVQKRQKPEEVSLWLLFIVCKTSEETSEETNEFWGACFRDAMFLPFCYSLFSCMWLYSSTLVRMQIGDSEEKQSSVTLPVLITEPYRLSAPIWFRLDGGIAPFFVTWCNYRWRFCVRKAVWLWFYPRSRKRNHFWTLATGVPELKSRLGTQRVNTSAPHIC